MRWKKNNIIAVVTGLLLCIFIACSSNEKQPVKKDALSEFNTHTDTSYPQLVFLVNPNDCISCLANFTHISGQLQHRIPASNIIMILPAKREIEQEKIKKELMSADVSCELLWNDSLFNAMFKGINSPTHQSYLVIKKYGQMLYAKPVKDIEGMRELEPFIKAQQ